MDYATKEMEMIEDAAMQADLTLELNELELALVGGGIGDTII